MLEKKSSALYIGEENLSAWAQDESVGIKTLFIDEANLTSRQWSEFEGLFNTPPGILINNEYVELTQEHKVIFAGNPHSYGGERQLPALFKRHGNSVVFEPMPLAYIYHKILSPVFENTGLNAQEIAIPLLNVAAFLTQCSEDKVLISPRELAMMALLTVAYCRENPTENPLTVARYYAYTLSKNFVPETYLAAFEQSYSVKTLPQQAAINPHDFLVSESNAPAINAVNDFLRLRQLRKTQTGNPVQQYGSLGGLILEGEPGIGKTALVVKTLIAHGIKQGGLTENHPNESVFYIMPASMPLSEKTALLFKAFHEGSIVVIDEINSAPMIERLLNDLLMGQTPDFKTATKPGFMVIGTQNSETLSGRSAASHALLHRMQKIKLPEYTPDEMIQVLAYKNLPQAISHEMVCEYQLHNQKALTDDALSILCFRDLLNCAEQEIQGLFQMNDEKNMTRAFAHSLVLAEDHNIPDNDTIMADIAISLKKNKLDDQEDSSAAKISRPQGQFFKAVDPECMDEMHSTSSTTPLYN